MSNFEKLVLQKSDSFTTFGTASLYSKVTGTFDSTETSMYAEVVGLAGSTGYGGASLANQTERYLLATTSFESPSTYDVYASFDSSNMISTSQTINGYMSDSSSWTVTPTGHDNFSSLQSSLEDDGKHFVTYQNGNYYRYILLLDKNNLGSSGSGSGSSSAADTSLLSWAYSSQSATDPDTLIDWATHNPDYSITEDTTDWKTDILAKVTAKGLNIDSLVAEYLFEDSVRGNNMKITFKDYITNKIN